MIKVKDEFVNALINCPAIGLKNENISSQPQDVLEIIHNAKLGYTEEVEVVKPEKTKAKKDVG